jgi:hypothetical protein
MNRASIDPSESRRTAKASAVVAIGIGPEMNVDCDNGACWRIPATAGLGTLVTAGRS